MTDFTTITACGECCTGCPKKLDGRCPGCIEADGRVPEWAESGRCKVHACTRDHGVQFCGLCAEFPCADLSSMIPWNPDVVEQMTALRNEYRRIVKLCGGVSSGKQVILLNGPSSSGKSTLAKELHTLIREQRAEDYKVVSIDDFMKTDPMETIYEDDVFEVSGEMCEQALTILRSGSGVIIDHVITSERIFRQLKETLYAYPLRTVHITCPLEVLIEREQARGNRCSGSAEASAEYLYPRGGYDLTVDTGAGSPRENALSIIEKLFSMNGEDHHDEKLC